ncbi:MAG: glycoside hydrolase family 2 TIM barrel-domain containing protein [Candidatus Omnitrophota bacterium]
MAQEASIKYVNKAWAASGNKEFKEVYEITAECIAKFSQEADNLAIELSDFAPKGEEGKYTVMNDVATCYFIKGEALMKTGEVEKAKKTFEEVINKYPWAQSFDPRGWFWSIKEKAEITLKKLITGRIEDVENIEDVVKTKIKLHDQGSEFPVNYAKYGKFKGVGTKDYRYIINNPIGLAKATGEGIYPNTNSVKFDPEYVKIRKKLFKIDHWQVLNSRDLSTAFYKWSTAPESDAVRQFYVAELLEKSGLIKQAVKGYYALLVHFPHSYSWTYWHTPWYVAKAAIYRLKYLLEKNPELELKLSGDSIDIVDGYDNDIRNDVFIVHPGELKRKSFWERKIAPRITWARKRNFNKIMASRGDKIKLAKYKNGDWQLFVNDKPFIIKGVTYAPTRAGESPDDGTLQNWTTQDLDKNGLIDSPYESWVDKNNNNIQDQGENIIGDFQLMKEMGVNVLRLYHQPFELNKKVLSQIYEKYGIYIILGDFLGKYALGSGANWEAGTDYDNPEHQKNMLESVRKMVNEFKDEPYILMWLLGNENVYGLGCNADKKPESFFKFVNQAALLIKSLDTGKRPVAIVSGDTLYLDIFARYCLNVDIFGTNSYRGKYGFLGLWDEVRQIAEKPAMITEYGAPSHAKGYSNEESQEYQANYLKSCWLNICSNSFSHGAGNAIGGVTFEWLDEWWKAYEPAYHDKKGLFSGPFLDGYMHEEWLGICSQGNGENSPCLRQLKKAYYTYKELWGKDN